MKALFVDTAGWISLSDSADPHHKACCAARDDWLRHGGLLVSTDFIQDETLTLIRFRLGFKSAKLWWDQVESSSRLRWEWIDALRAEKARRWFFYWRDKDFSFTDCTSFVVMRELRLRKALTTDAHFRQAGFQMVP